VRRRHVDDSEDVHVKTRIARQKRSAEATEAGGGGAGRRYINLIRPFEPFIVIQCCEDIRLYGDENIYMKPMSKQIFKGCLVDHSVPMKASNAACRYPQLYSAVEGLIP
jgi:hypothetical protein